MAEHLGLADGGGTEAMWRPSVEARRPSLGAVTRALRPYQWLKNTLVFLPFLLAHEIASAEKWARALLMFAAFSLCASAAYVINDILDRGQDRRHPRRSLRPIASGELPLRAAVWLPAPLVAAAALCCVFLPPSCAAALAAYLGLTAVYSGAAKKLVMADVLLLAGLYLLRLMAGSLATGNVVSRWLLAFALTLFLSLALSKRVSELMTWRAASLDHAPGRGYRATDAPVLEAMAVASGFLACLIMVLYIQSPEILRLYSRPEYLWCGVVALLYWLGRLFIYAHRGECPDDPLFFALQDKTTLVVLAASAALAVFAV
jgi:4-hydroxybenzoate polyprenyltransferase